MSTWLGNRVPRLNIISGYLWGLVRLAFESGDSVPSVSLVFKSSDWITPLGFLGLQLADDRSWDFSASTSVSKKKGRKKEKEKTMRKYIIGSVAGEYD